MENRTVDTRERILDAGERLFMAHGYEGTSMRQITSEACVNLAAVNYHFGSKESLMQEVFRRRLDWLRSSRRPSSMPFSAPCCAWRAMKIVAG